MPDDAKPAAQIRCVENGPLIVSGVGDLKAADGTANAAKPRMFLCRCGGSMNKPFCVGSHKNNGFESAKQEGRTADERKTFAGKAVTIHDNRGLCAHAGVCTDSLPDVWRMQGGPWIDPDAAEAGAIADVVRRCPSGALAYALAERVQGDTETAGEPVIQVAKDGPYHVTGVELTGEEWGQGAARGRYTLCRCGASKNKPFCDGSHWDVGFMDGS